jgi:hypothetical protein
LFRSTDHGAFVLPCGSADSLSSRRHASGVGSVSRPVRSRSATKAEFQPTTWQAFWGLAVEGKSGTEVAAALGLSIDAVYAAKTRVLCIALPHCGRCEQSLKCLISRLEIESGPEHQ